MRLWLWKFMECFKVIQFSIFSTHFTLIAGRKSLACGLISLSSLHRECLVFPFLWGPVQYIDTEWALRNWSWQTFTLHLGSDARLKCFTFLDILQEGEYPVPGSGDLPTCFLWQTAEIGLHQFFWEHIIFGLFWCCFQVTTLCGFWTKADMWQGLRKSNETNRMHSKALICTAEKPCSGEISLGKVATDVVQALHAKPRMAVARGQKQRCFERCGWLQQSQLRWCEFSCGFTSVVPGWYHCHFRWQWRSGFGHGPLDFAYRPETRSSKKQRRFQAAFSSSEAQKQGGKKFSIKFLSRPSQALNGH